MSATALSPVSATLNAARMLLPVREAGTNRGRFIRPALIHDVRCEFRVGTWQDTHEQFLENLHYEGVSRWRRRAMYAAVWTFGPRWPAWQRRSAEQLQWEMSKPLGPNGKPWGDYA